MKKLIIISTFVMFLYSCTKEETKVTSVDCSNISAKYSSDIKPIIETNCNYSGCHNVGTSYGEMSTYDDVKAQLDKGDFQEEVLEERSMPKGSSLTTDEYNKIKCWVDSGYPNN